VPEQYYFDKYGNSGDAEDIIIIHKEIFTEEEFQMIMDSPREIRTRLAKYIADKAEKEIKKNKRTLRGL